MNFRSTEGRYFTTDADTLAPDGLVYDGDRVINLTTHVVNVLLPDNTQLAINPSGTVARIQMDRTRVGTVLGVPVNIVVQGRVEGMPQPRPGTYYLVSQLIQSAMPDRDDLLVPDSTLKRADRSVVGARAFTRNPSRGASPIGERFVDDTVA